MWVNFDRPLKLKVHGSKTTSDAGFLAYREPADALGLTKMAADLLDDPFTGHNVLYSMMALLQQSIFNGLAGYEDTYDAEGGENDLVFTRRNSTIQHEGNRLL